MNATDTNAVPEEKDVQTRLKSAARVVDLVDPTRGDDPDVPAGSVGAGYVGYAAWLPPDASPIPHPWGDSGKPGTLKASIPPGINRTSLDRN